MKLFGTALLLVLVSVVTARTTTNSNPCSMTCSSSQDSLFKSGQTYSYIYEGESNVNTVKGLYETTGILIKSRVKITALSNCEMKLSMSDVQVFDKTTKDGNTFQESPNSGKVKKLLEQNEVFFTRENEHVRSICMDREEPIWSENIKKVIINSIANQGIQTKQYTRQMTSHGNCLIGNKTEETSYSSTTVNLEYNLKNCKNEKMPKSIFTDLTQATLFDTSQVNCRYVYESKTSLKNIHCTEKYQMIPFKQNANRIVVEIQTRLTEESQTKSTDRTFSNQNVIETGIEQSQDELQHDESTYSSVKQVLKDICAQQVTSTSSMIPKLFMKLINQLKDLNSKEFKEIYLDVLKTDICSERQSEIRSIFYDAVSFVNTPASTSVMVDLIKSNQLSSFDQNVWLASLSFMQQTPTIEMLKDLESLISTDKPTSPMYLGISAVTHLYCKNNYESCVSDPTVKSIINKFLTNLNSDCSQSKDSNKDYLSPVQISLKALGNLKFFSNQVTDVLKKCVSLKTNPLSIRVSALEVMKHMDCQKDRSIVMEILENNENDSELRINAYLTVMGCPDISNLFKIRKILSKEQVNQVGSFIWTHLSNIKESRDPVKAGIQELLENVELKKVFDISKLKFSRNIEKTFKTENFGMTFDSNVIFSEKSFVPRSVSLNTTATIFERPTNFIEMSARLEGLEELLYKLFGPQGYVNKQSNVEDNLALINMLNEMNGNMNIKLYGQQISFIELIRGSLGSVKKYNILEEIMNWSQNKQFEMNKNIQIIDKTAVIQTMLGFPLQLKIQGSVSMNIKIKSKIDIDNLFRWPISFNIDNLISPNINAEFNADVVLQAPFSRYGMRLNLKSGTNTELKAKILAKGSEEFSIEFDTAKTKQEIISIEGNAYVIHRSHKILQLADKMKQNQLCTPEQVTRVLGVKICVVRRFIDPELKKNTLFSGPFSASIYIEKQDTLTGYVIRASSKSVSHVESGLIYTNRFIKFEMDTPGSKIYNRRFFGEFVLDFKEKHAKLELSTPWNQVLVMTNFKFTNQEKKMRFNFQIDKKDIIDIMAEHVAFSKLKGNTIRCGITVSVLKFTPIKTKWSLETSNEQWLFNFNSKGLMKDDTQIKIKVTKVKSTRELSLFNKYEVSGFYNSYFGSGKISGIASENYYGHRWDVKLNHKPRDKNQNEFMFVFRHKTEDKSSKNLNKYILTTTFAYGKDADNVVKFRTESEFSEKHIRTSLKISSGQNTKSITDFIDLQLYGGYRWKEDNRHYAEGSLSVKLPTKNLNYEGRYNSEVGKRMFKLALALDKDQQSKLNLKINYLQPQLYLKNTDLEIAFSIPNNNIDVNWNLVETEVNRYQYSLQTKYNKYEMRLDGVQTQISRLNHDSSVTIKMPNIESLPKQVNINLKVNLVDPTKASIKGKIEIPNSNYQYSIDTKLSYIPQNLFQISSSDTNSVFKYDIEFSSLTRVMKSKFIFTCNPEEFQTYFNLNLDNDKTAYNQIEFDIHGFHKNPNYKQFDNFGRITLSYPGNSHSIGFKSEFKYTEMMAQIDFTWNRDRKISINTMYEIDNSWTQKGLRTSLTIKTPFIGFEQTHFGINAVGQLRYRKIDFECKWGPNKKILFDIIIYPKSSNDFSLNWKLVTPFQGWNLISFHLKHMHTLQSISSQASLEIGPKRRYQIKFDGANNSEGKNRDYAASVLIESGLYPELKISFLHKDDTVHFKSNFDALWMKTESIKIKSDISYTFEDSELITKGTVELSSTLRNVNELKAIWLLDNRNGQFLNSIELLHNTKQFLQSSVKGFYELEAGTFKMEFNGLVTVMNTRTINVASNLNYQNLYDFQHRFSLNQDTATLYSHNFVSQKKLTKLKFLIPRTEFKTINIEYSEKEKETLTELESFIQIGEKFLIKCEEVYTKKISTDLNRIEIDFTSNFYSDFLEIKEFQNKGKFITEKDHFKLEMITTSGSLTTFELIAEVTSGKTKQKLHLAVKSKYESLNKFNLLYENFPTEPNKPMVNKLEINLNEVFTLNAKITTKNLQLIDIDISVKHRHFHKYLRLKHNYDLINYEHLFDTNIFGKTIRFTSSTVFRGVFSLKLKLNADFRFLKSFDLVANYIKGKEINFFFQLQKDSQSEIKYRISYSNHNSHHKLSIEANSYFQTDIQLDLSQYPTILFEVKSLLHVQPLVRFQFDYKLNQDSMKFENEVKLNIGNQEFKLKNKMDNIKWKYLWIESEMKCDFHRFANYRIQYEYQLKPSRFLMTFQSFSNNRYIKLFANLDSNQELKVELKLLTSFSVLKEIIFVLKQKQSNLYTQMAHQCKVSIQSYGNEFQSDHKIEWSGKNYIKIDLSMSGKMPENSLLIQPKSFKFIHHFNKNMLNEDLQITFSQNVHLKTKLQIPLQSKSKSSFELETSFQQLKKLVVDLDVNFLEKEDKSILFKIQKDLENLFVWESKYKNKNQFQLLSTNFEVYNNYKTGVEFELTETAFGTKVLKGKFNNPLLREAIILNAKYDSFKKDLSITVNGAIDEKMTVNAKLSETQYILKVKYGQKLFHVDVIYNPKEINYQFKLISSNDIAVNLQFVKPFNLCKISFKFRENSFEVTADRNGELALNFNILNRKMNLNLKRESKQYNQNYIIQGKSNLQGWNEFKGQFQIFRDNSRGQLKLVFNKEAQTLLNVVVDKLPNSFTIQYSSIYDLIKSGSLEVDYENFPKKFTMKAEATNLGKVPLKFEYKLDGETITGQASSPFEWMREMSIQGKLSMKDEEMKGSFYINHNKLDKAITGEFSLEMKTNLFKIELKTPFSYPYNELSFKREMSKTEYVVDIANKENKIIAFKFTKSSDRKYQAELEITLSKPLKEFTFSLSGNVDLEDDEKSVKLVTKSNLFEEHSLEMIVKKNDYLLKFSNSYKEGQLQLQISSYQSSGTQIKTLAQYGQSKHVTEFVYEIKNLNDVYLKSVVKSTIFSSSTGFEAHYKHKLVDPNNFNLDTQCKFNDKVIFDKSISWQRQLDNSFDFTWKIVLSPNDKEYENKIQLLSKRGEIFNLIITATDLLENPIDIRLAAKSENFELSLQSPFELAKSIRFNVRREYKSKHWTQTITLETNKLGRYQINTEYQLLFNDQLQLTFQVDTPTTNKQVFSQINIQMRSNEQSFTGQLELNGLIYNVNFNRQFNQIQLKLSTPLKYFSKFEMMIKEKINAYEIEMIYNQDQAKFTMTNNQETIDIKIESNTVYFKVISISVQKSQTSVSVKLNMDEKHFKFDCNTNEEMNSFKYSSQNDLLPFLPKSFSGKYQYSSTPINFQVEFKSNEITFFQIIVNEQQILFHNKIQIFKTSITEMKFSATKSKIEMILLSNDVFSILVTRMPENQIDAAVTVYGNQYSMKTIIENDSDKLIFKLSTYKNTVEKLFEINNEIGKRETFIDFNVIYLSKSILKLKLITKNRPTKIISLETKLFSFDGVADLAFVSKRNFMNLKISWNLHHLDQQLSIGSIEYLWKSSRPSNYLMSINLHDMAFQVQLIESDNGQFRIKVSTPFRGIDMDLKWLLTVESGMHKLWCSIDNSFTGEYSIKSAIRTNKDPEVKFILSSNIQIINWKLNLITSVPNEITFNTELRLFDWEKIRFNGKLSTKDLIELILTLNTPFKVARHIQVEKTLRFITIVEHKYTTKVIYDGVMKVKYVGGHEINWGKKIIKFQSSFHNEDLKIVSITMDHSGDHDRLNHSFIWNFKDQSYGMRMDGGFKPLFEGRSEIVTPFHKVGKIVLFGKQMENGILIEAGNDKNLASFEYMKKKNISLLKISPPEQYGEPIGIKYQTRRFKRSLDNEIETEITYGNDKVIEWHSNIEMNKDKYSANLNLAAPKLSTKSVRLSFNHKFNEKTVNFDHKLTVKDAIQRVYRLFGNIVRENSRHMQIALNSEHPEYGLIHLSLGHSLADNSYVNNFLLKSDDKTVLMHNGNIKFDFEKPSLSGVWNTQIKSNHHKWAASHSGDWKDYMQSMLMEHNKKAYLKYRSQIKPQGKSDIAIEFPTIDGIEIKIVTDNEEKKIEISLKSKFHNFLVDMTNKHGILQMTCKADNKNIADLSIGYGAQPFYIKGNYLKNSGNLQLTLNNDLITLKMASTFTKLTKVSLEVSKKSLVADFDYHNKPYRVNLKYSYSPDYAFITMETSLKALSNFEFHVSTKKCKLIINEFFQTLEYVIKRNHIQLIGNNNFMSVKKILIDLQLETPNKALATLQLNSFALKSKIEYSNDQITLESENNYFPLRSTHFEMARKIENDLQYWTVMLSANKIQTFRIQFEIKNRQYSLGIENYLGHHLVASYKLPEKEMIISFKTKTQTFNVINKIREISLTNSKTITIVTDIESSSLHWQKFQNEFSYTTTDSSYQLKQSFRYGVNSLQFNGELSKSKIHAYLKMDNIVYSVTILPKSKNDLEVEFIIPRHHTIMKFQRDNNQLSCDIECNKKRIFNVVIKQSPEIRENFHHESVMYYREQMIWNFKLETDFKKYEMKMRSPVTVDLTIVNDWNAKEMTSLGFVIKYDTYPKPVEFGGEIKFLITNNLQSYQVNMENNYHLITWKKSFSITDGKQTTVTLMNKKTKDQWQLTVKSIPEKNFELHWKTPTSKHEIKYNQIIENNIRISVDLNVFDIFKFNLKADKNSPNLRSGSLTLFSTKIAAVEVGQDYVQATFNDAGNENEKVLFKWTCSTQGEWKKNYLSVKQLMLVQKSLNINLNIVQKTKMDSSFYSKSMTINYQLINGEMKTFTFGSSVDFSKANTLILELENPILPIKTVLTRIQPDSTSLRYEMETKFNDNDIINGFFLLKTGSNPGVTINVHHNPQDRSEFVQLHSKYIDDRQIETHVFHEKNSKKTTYFHILLRLLNEHHIETTLEWKTYTLSQLNRELIQYKNRLLGKIFTFIHRESRLMKFRERFEQFKKIIPDSQTVVLKMKTIERQLDIEWKSFGNELRSIYNRNEFYFRTINEKIFDTLDRSVKLIKTVVKRIIPFIEEVQIKITRAIQVTIKFSFAVHNKIFPNIGCLLRPIVNRIYIYSYFVYQISNDNVIYMLENLRSFIDRTLTNAIQVTIQIKKLTKLVILKQTSKAVITTIEIIKSIARKFRSDSFEFLKHENEMKIMYNKFIDKLEKISEKLIQSIQSLMNQADDQLSFLTGEKYLDIIRKDLSALSGYVIEQLRDERYQRMVTNFIYSSVKDSFIDLELKIQDITTNLIWPYVALVDMDKDQRFDNEKDFKLIVRYTLPIPMNDLKSLPDFGYVTRKINKIKHLIEATKQMCYQRLSSGTKLTELKDWFIPTFPQLSWPSILPEFESYATISKTSVVTFDKQMFQLTSDSCQVLLSKDNKYKKWEIILNQQKETRSYKINIGSNSFEISGTDYKILLNGKPSELPLKIGSTNLIGLGRVMKLNDDDLGLTITVDPMNEMLTVGISGWYHAKVRGLFGNNDNEPFNDLMLDDGTIVNSDSFMKAFNYNGATCKIVHEKEKEIKPTKNCPFIRRVACKFLFKCPFSPMSSCFKTVDPTNFMNMCINSKDELSRLDPHVCQSARQYQAQCSHAGIQVSVPTPCQKCDVKNEKSLRLNEFRTIKIKEKASDIIFVVDEGDCLNSLESKLSNIVLTLEREMHAKSIDSVKFGLVTFVDQANFHTVGQKMLGSSEEVIRAIQALKTSDGKFKDKGEAILLASNYPFREHASRHIVMISCRSTTELSVRFDTISYKLQQKAIHFSLLTDFSFRLKDNNMKTIIFGVDSKNIYSPLSRTGDRNITIRPENDVLYELAMKLRGVVFDYKFLTSNQVLTQKSFVNTFVSQISQRATPARSTRCTCINDGEYSCVPLDVHPIFPVTKVV